MAETETRTIRPQLGPQEIFLSSSADIAIYGGAAYGGKTWALLMEPIRHINNPGFGGVIFRRTSPQITNEGGLWDESEKLYPLAGATPLIGSLDWRFRSGANIGFRHLQHEANKYDWQGSQVCYLGFDELTHFSESQFFYLMSRNRSTCGVRPYIRGTCNPDATSWVKRFLAPWVDRSFPNPARSGEVRYFVREDGKIKWVSADHRDAGGSAPKSVTFVKATIYDNKIGLARDPGYLGNLKSLPDVERARLLEGDWDVVREGLVYPGFAQCIVDPCPLPEGTRIGGMDFGFNNPFAAVAGILDHDDVLWIHWMRFKSWATLPEHSVELPRDGTVWYADPARPDSIAELRIAQHNVKSCVHKGPKPLLTGIDRVTARIKTGRLKVFSTCADLIREASLYHYDEDKQKEEPVDEDNHSLDALRYLVVGIDRRKAVKDRPPGPTPDEIAAREAAAEDAKRKAQEAHLNPMNPMLWR